MKNLFKGLSTAEVDEKRKNFGSNVIVEAEPPTFWEAFKEGFEDPMIKILCAISILMIGLFVLGLVGVIPSGSVSWYEPVGTIIAILIVNTITAKTSISSDKAYRKLKNSIKKDTVKVYRDGVVTVVEIDDIVVGDVVILQAGDKIPADGVLVQGEIRVNNSALNGETEECKKTAAPEEFTIPEEITGDTFTDKHSLFRGAVVYNGEGLMVIQKVGMNTMMGKMAEDMADVEETSPLKEKLGVLANQISKFGYIGAIVIAFAYLVHFVFVAGGVGPWIATGWLEVFKSVIEAVMVAIVIIVCAVPEGLPLLIALVLMQNTGRLLEHNCLVRKAVGIETAGGLNILFSDKTGTITKGQLEVVNVFGADGKDFDKSESNAIRNLMNIAIGRNTSAVFDSEHNIVGGNVTDRALMEFLSEETFNTLATEYDVTESQAFNSANKFSQARIGSEGKTFYKGAPEKLLEKAKKCLNAKGEVVDLDVSIVNKKIDELAEDAKRVLAFGYSESAMTENSINDDIVIIGFVGIRDEVRPEAADSIKKAQKAGIQVVMITGDRLETAAAIAKSAGLLTGSVDVIRDIDISVDENGKSNILELVEGKDTVALTSAVLNKLSDDDVKAIMSKIRVIARALPTDKSRMTKLCRELNLVGGMTGDGINDAPALKNADVGFAMGSGTEGAKEASDLIITDDNFKSIVDAVWYGRTIFHNILKFCKVQLSINVGAVVLSAIGPFIGIEVPLTVVQLLFVNLVMDSLSSIMLGNEPALERYMEEKPINRDAKIVSKPMFIQFTIMGLYMAIMSIIICKVPAIVNLFGGFEQAKTGIFAMFIITAMFNVFNCRAEDLNLFYKIGENKTFFKVWISIIVATIIACLFGGEFMGCTPFTLTGWAIVFAIAILAIPFDILRKVITKAIVGEYI